MAHKCSWETVQWKNDYHLGGLGETLERSGECRMCGKIFREVYLHSCIMDDEANETADLTEEGGVK